MKKLLVLAVVFAASSAHVPAFAGGCGGGGGGPAGKPPEFSCSNQCPLAQAANTHRSLGLEATGCSAAVRASMAAAVQRNLLKF